MDRFESWEIKYRHVKASIQIKIKNITDADAINANVIEPSFYHLLHVLILSIDLKQKQHINT
jgi:hypothetical protein